MTTEIQLKRKIWEGPNMSQKQHVVPEDNRRKMNPRKADFGLIPESRTGRCKKNSEVIGFCRLALHALS
jgi:hypothetical protein